MSLAEDIEDLSWIAEEICEKEWQIKEDIVKRHRWTNKNGEVVNLLKIDDRYFYNIVNYACENYGVEKKDFAEIIRKREKLKRKEITLC